MKRRAEIGNRVRSCFLRNWDHDTRGKGKGKKQDLTLCSLMLVRVRNESGLLLPHSELRESPEGTAR